MVTPPLREIAVPRPGRAGSFFAHPHALVETSHIGEGTRVWAFAHIMPGAKIGRKCIFGQNTLVADGVVIGSGVGGIATIEQLYIIGIEALSLESFTPSAS